MAEWWRRVLRWHRRWWRFWFVSAGVFAAMAVAGLFDGWIARVFLVAMAVDVMVESYGNSQGLRQTWVENDE